MVETPRLVRAFKTSYRRMRWDEPASTLTTNSGVISSDVKGHPSQNRVLSLREVLIVASLDAHPGRAVPWQSACAVVESFPDTLVRHVAGESIPPRMTKSIVDHLETLK